MATQAITYGLLVVLGLVVVAAIAVGVFFLVRSLRATPTSQLNTGLDPQENALTPLPGATVTQQVGVSTGLDP